MYHACAIVWRRDGQTRLVSATAGSRNAALHALGLEVLEDEQVLSHTVQTWKS